METAIGFDVGGTKIAAALFDAHGAQVGAVEQRETPRNYEAFLDVCETLFSKVSAEAEGKASLGVCLPGPVDRARGTAKCVNLPDLYDKPLSRDLAQRLGFSCPIPLANDANAMALAEAVDGAGQGAESVLGLIIGTGIGAGFIFRGQIVDGPDGMTGEIGHLPLPFRTAQDGPLTPCNCGQNGCIEKAIAGPALAKLYAFMTGEPEKDAETIARAAQSGEPKALHVLDRYYEIVAKALTTVLHAYNPEVITVSGGLSALQGLYTEVPQRWGRYTLIKNPRTKLVPARHGPMAGVRGAAFVGRGLVTP